MGLIGRLFGVREEAAVTPARVPPGGRVYAVGDIHGRLDLLKRLQRRILEDAEEAAPARKTIVYLGDYVDRGLESKGVIDRLLETPLPGFEAVHLLGNHEHIMLGFLEESALGPAWLGIGGDATLYSYGVAVPQSEREEEIAAAQAAFKRAVPQAHLDFLRTLRPHHVAGDYLFVHAGLRPGITVEGQSLEDLIWIRDAFLTSDEDFGKVVVHGHSISRAVEMRPNRIGIDTGAFATGELTCLVLEAAERKLLHT